MTGCASVNTGLISRMIARYGPDVQGHGSSGDVSGLFMGHDHRNTYDGNYNGMLLIAACHGQESISAMVVLVVMVVMNWILGMS